MHGKREKLKSFFFLIQQEGEIVVQKMEIKKIKVQTKRKGKNEVKWKRDEQKQEVIKLRMEVKLVRKKNTKNAITLYTTHIR